MRLSKLDIFFLVMGSITLILSLIAVLFPPESVGASILKQAIDSAVNSERIGEIANEIKARCSYWRDKKQCYIRETFNWVNKNVNYTNDDFFEQLFWLNNEPEYTLEHGNDCEGKAALVVAILKRLNVTNIYLVFEDNHVCLLVRETEKNFKSFNCYDDEVLYLYKVG